jgi:hypothetical protein
MVARYPEAGVKGVSSPRLVQIALLDEAAQGVDLDRLELAVAAYGRSPGDWGSSGRPVALHRLISDGRYQAYMPGPKAGAEHVAFAGPPELRAAIAAAVDEGFAVSYLDRCGWSEERRVLTAWSGRAFEKLHGQVGPLITNMDITLVRPSSAVAAE